MNKSNKRIFTVKDIVIIGISIAFALLYSVTFSYYFTEANKLNTVYNNNYTIGINTVNYTSDSDIPTGYPSAETVEDSMKASIQVRAVGNSSTSYGSGSIFMDDGTYSYAITCHHVIAEARSTGLSVTIYDDGEDGTVYNGATFSGVNVQLVGSDPETDIAVIRFRSIGYQTVDFINSNDDIYTGEMVYSIGYSLAMYPYTCTTGVINQKEREVTIQDLGVYNLIQTSAAINGGMSGGGLFDANGVMVGMINSGYSSSVAQNINFAIPAYTIYDIASQLITNTDSATGFGYVEGRYNLGLTIGTIGATTTYPIVTEVPTDSSFYGTNFSSSLQLYDLLKSVKIGDNPTVTLTTASNMITIFDTYETSVEVGTQIVFLAAQNYGINDIERTVTVTVKQYVFTL